MSLYHCTADGKMHWNYRAIQLECNRPDFIRRHVKVIRMLCEAGIEANRLNGRTVEDMIREFGSFRNRQSAINVRNTPTHRNRRMA